MSPRKRSNMLVNAYPTKCNGQWLSYIRTWGSRHRITRTLVPRVHGGRVHARVRVHRRGLSFVENKRRCSSRIFFAQFTIGPSFYGISVSKVLFSFFFCSDERATSFLVLLSVIIFFHRIRFDCWLITTRFTFQRDVRIWWIEILKLRPIFQKIFRKYILRIYRCTMIKVLEQTWLSFTEERIELIDKWK